MLQKCETPRLGGVLRNSFGGCFRDASIPFGTKSQFQLGDVALLIATKRASASIAIVGLEFGSDTQ